MKYNYLLQYIYGKNLLMKSVCMLMLLLSSYLSMSQSIMPGTETDKDWNFVVAPYLWFSGLDGQLAVGRIETDVSADFSDIFSNLNMAFMLYGEVRYKKIGFAVDFLTLSMSMEGVRPIIGGAVEVDQDMKYLETSLLYSLIHNEKWSAEVHAGIRSWWLDTQLEAERIISDETRKVESNISWVDPIIGAKAIFLPHEKWPINAKVDFGGFGAGSEFTWQFLVGGGYKFAKSWTALLQYRYLGVDYRTGRLF